MVWRIFYVRFLGIELLSNFFVQIFALLAESRFWMVKKAIKIAIRNTHIHAHFPESEVNALLKIGTPQRLEQRESHIKICKLQGNIPC